MVNIRVERIDRGYTQAEFADLAGITQGYLSMLETGRREPGRKLVRRLSEIFDIPVRDFFDD